MEDWRVSREALKDPNDDEQVWWDVIERVFDELATPHEPDPRLERLTPGQRALYALHWTRSEVGNGGFHQYLHNPTGMLAGEASQGAGLIGALEIGDVLRELHGLFPGGEVPAQQGERIAFLERVDRSELDQHDERFYELLPSLATCCAAYVGAHPDEFFLPQRELSTPS